MKKLSLIFLSFLLVSGSLKAQTKVDNRTISTRIADVLAQFPAQDAQQLATNMNEVGALGEAGLVEIAKMLVPPGQGDNSKIQYALGGFSYYVTQGNRENLRAMAANAYVKALDQVTDPINKTFLIFQLQMVGKDEAVAALIKNLGNDQVCGPAARALVKINTASAKTALLNALSQSQGTCQMSLVEALGDSRDAAAVSAISKLVSSSDPKMKKVALFALANIGDPAAEPVLAAEAEKAGFAYQNANATAAYLRWAETMLAAGNKSQVEKMAQTLLSKTTQDNQVPTRIAALKFLVRIQGEQSLPLLLTAANDNNQAYRVAALTQATEFKTGTSEWLTALKKAKPAAKADIINFFGIRQDAAALPALLKAVKNKKQDVKVAAIIAAGKVGQEAALPAIIKAMRKGDSTVVQTAQTAILTMKGTNVVPQVSQALPKMKEPARAALLEVLGSRKASEQINVVLAQAKSKNPEVELAALTALKDMATQENLTSLYPLLLAADRPEEVTVMQEAIYNAVKGESDKAKQTDIILQQMAQAPADKKLLYYSVLSKIGGKKALQTVVTNFKSGNDETKKAAFAALGNWTDFSAATEIFNIAQSDPNSSYFDQALRGYVRQVSTAKFPAEQKLLLLTKVMDIAKTSDQKTVILREVGKSPTYLSLLLAGKYLDDPALNQVAADAVTNIALNNKNIFGQDVRDLLNKAMSAMQGAEVEYTKANIRKLLDEMPKEPGFVSMFNGTDLTGWKGLVADPIKRSKMDAKTLAAAQQKADEQMRQDWQVKNGEIVFVGKGFDNLTTVKKYADFEMLVDWKIYDDGKKEGDAGIYLRGTPQVQMWDTARVKDGAQVGSGGLYNNKVNPSKPLKVADNPLGEWNNFRILMQGDRVTVYLNGELVTDNVILENYWDAKLPIFPQEQIELQAHGSPVGYRNLYIREIPRPKPYQLSAAEEKEGYKILFDGTNMHEWQGNTIDYTIDAGTMLVSPKPGSRGNLYTKDQYSDFVFRFEFQLTPGANNGLGIRAPLEGDAAYTGIELQILDNEADIYKALQPYQYHGSAYGILPAKRGYLKPIGEWNYQEVMVKGPKIKVILNGTTILDGDLTEARKNGTADHKDHPGINRDSGYIGFLGHGSTLAFRNIRIKDLSKKLAVK
ncbi:hypothetical protein AHMF7605_11050 [Adhaeribacter arboris]|uniref:3-keto-alpha-glucoside-1,2-lyase/3-keto-2-hydroxy-glucal hydratase domain-containing protein n=2 Tax=Adhaeribacter arboris TaxID=2072846 RepID=A0A2T2YP17_9BACT|nr:hypothetical protein AHMF7605_11050 [Adhaeribacter arboris]